MARLNRLMYGLLYPAVLGAVLLNILSPVSRLVEDRSASAPDFSVGKLILIIGIALHFVVDYVLGQEAPERGWPGFAVDCGVLIGLWVAAAGSHMNSSVAPNVPIVCWALVCVYVLFLLYLRLVYRKIQKSSQVAVVEVLSLLSFVLGALLESLTFAAVALYVSAMLLLWVGNRALLGGDRVVERVEPPLVETPTEIPRVEESVSEEFHVKEWESLREEIAIQIEHTRKLELATVVGMGAFYAWFVSTKVYSPSRFILVIPFLLALLGGLRALGTLIRINEIAKYIKTIESKFSLGRDNLIGWDRTREKKLSDSSRRNLSRFAKSSPFAVSATFFWLAALVVSVLAWFYLPQPLEHPVNNSIHLV